MKVLVVGATGMVGGAVARMLSEKGNSVRALLRPTADADKKANLTSAGIETVGGDIRDTGSLDAACAGMDAVISTVSAMPFSWQEDNTIGVVDRDGIIGLIDSAKRASVTRFVHVSFPIDPGISFPLAKAKQAVKDHLKSGGIEYTIVAANFFMEVWLNPAFGFDYSAGNAAVFGDGKNPISWVSYIDVARTAVEAVSNPRAKNKVLPVGGPDALSPLEAIEIFQNVTGKTWNVDYVPVDGLKKQMQDAADEVQESVAGLQLFYATSTLCGMDTGEYLITDGLKSIELYAREVSG